jgi:glycosyltransferase involved in cell wall biosynthesis
VKISVITPSFKQLQWLKLCSASVADQEGVDVEHIVQDAGTGPELEQWAAMQPRLKLSVEKDCGMYDAVNKGLLKSSGEICAYINCDEQYLSQTLVRVTRFFSEHPKVEVLFGDIILNDILGRPLSYRRIVLPSKVHTRLVHLNTMSCATFFRRSILDRGFIFDPSWKTIGDAVWIYQLLESGIRMARVSSPLASFTITDANLGQSMTADAERKAWSQGSDSPPSWLRLPAIGALRLRKLCAGAYLPRKMDIALYTLDSPSQRRAFRNAPLGTNWPEMA